MIVFDVNRPAHRDGMDRNYSLRHSMYVIVKEGALKNEVVFACKDTLTKIKDKLEFSQQSE